MTLSSSHAGEMSSISSITEGDPLAEHHVYGTLAPNTLIVDARYGSNSVLAENVGRTKHANLIVRDGAGMVVEGYIIPSRELAKFWGYTVSPRIYAKVGRLFTDKPRLL